MDFWKEYLDDLARHRYNTLSYWTKLPFTTMIKLEEYPDVEVLDVIVGYGNYVKKEYRRKNSLLAGSYAALK